MPARSNGSGTITFGLVTIPVKLYTATRAQSAGFNMLHKPPCGARVKQQLVCPAHEPAPVLERGDTVKGFEHARDEFVVFTDEEIKAIEAERPTVLELVEFVPAETVDFLFIEKTQYLGPDKGGDNAYRTLADALERSRRIGVGRFANRGKDTLVLLRPYRHGLILHEAFYAHEVCPFDEVPKGVPKADENAVMMAQLLIERLQTDRFAPENYRDEWSEKVKALVARKIAGEEFVIPAAAPTAKILDLVEALKRSIAGAQKKVESERTAQSEPEPSTLRTKGGVRKALPRPRKKTAGEKRRRGTR